MKMLEHGMKIRKELIFLDEITYYAESHSYYDDGLRHIYKFLDEDDNVYVWKTTKSLGIESYDSNGYEIFEFVNVGDRVFLAGSVKEISNFRGEDQIVITRCQLRGVDREYYSEEEIVEIRRRLQLSKFENYEIKTMRYGEYKTDYQKYETLVGSFIRKDNGSFVDVIIPKENLE